MDMSKEEFSLTFNEVGAINLDGNSNSLSPRLLGAALHLNGELPSLVAVVTDGKSSWMMTEKALEETLDKSGILPDYQRVYAEGLESLQDVQARGVVNDLQKIDEVNDFVINGKKLGEMPEGNMDNPIEPLEIKSFETMP